MNKVGIAFNTCDRIDYTKQTLPRIIEEEGDFDLFWIDGSKTDEGKNFHRTAFPSLRVTERHPNVTGGAVAGIKYSWQTLYNKGYEYIGLIENDVKLTPGWFKKTMALFNHPNFSRPVGIASARCFTHRVANFESGEGYAIMADVGAGMCIIKRELIPILANNFRRAALWEVRALFKHFTGLEYPTPPMCTKQDPELKQEWFLSEDWYWPVVAASRGFATLATIPSLAYNLDDPDGFRDPVQWEKI